MQVLPALGLNGYKVNQVTNWRPIDNSRPSEMPSPGFFEKCYYKTQELRHGQMLPVNMIVTGGFMRPIYERLAQNEIVVMAVDGRAEGKLTPYPFLGRETCMFSNGPVRLALRTGATVLPSFTVREADMRNTLVIEEEICLDRDHSSEDQIKNRTEVFVKLLEKYVHEYPDHCGMEFFNERDQISGQKK